VPRGQRDGSLRPYSRLSRPDSDIQEMERRTAYKEFVLLVDRETGLENLDYGRRNSSR
jgi:hypothetical protein